MIVASMEGCILVKGALYHQATQHDMSLRAREISN